MTRLGKQLSIKFKGTLGCFISHYNCWEKFLGSNCDHALILEDDFLAKIRFPSEIEALRIPKQFDICWLTQHMQTKKVGQLEYVHVKNVLIERVSPNWQATGGYGYILSRKGAERLAQYVFEDGFYGDVDWRMLSYSLDSEILKRLPVQSHARKTLEEHFRVISARQSLSSYATSIGLVGHEFVGSARRLQNAGIHYYDEDE